MICNLHTIHLRLLYAVLKLLLYYLFFQVVSLIAWSFYSSPLNLYDNAGATKTDISLCSLLQV